MFCLCPEANMYMHTNTHTLQFFFFVTKLYMMHFIYLFFKMEKLTNILSALVYEIFLKKFTKNKKK